MLVCMITKDRIEQTEQTRDEIVPGTQTEPLADVVNEIRSDALQRPEVYLRETRVPADGE